ncbi:hypothetical protein C8P68_1098 [Mucilaginibacter yixingensis]|uniref:Protein phosphatase 2C-like protein n=1 Tax=Mucilaginibacter yixingensis TaxID=1295612 RepID=A0A2T5J587_9SPHI|nr:hypothetical protein [Mucilaginibacter yixingensis]PTQ93136.1 hypothetical protein C8P68_1098 [Mucilaginibacter yixingensis]
MIITEQYLKGKFDDAQQCEDVIFTSDDFIAVIDGATSKAGTIAADQITSGKRAGQLISEVLSTLPADTDMQSAISNFNQLITAYYHQNKSTKYYWDNPIERLTASTVIYSKNKHELWMIGDCMALINGKLITNYKKVDEVCSGLRSAFITNQLMRNETSVEQLSKSDTGRNFILPLLRWSIQFQNCGYDHEFAYSVIDGFPVSPKLIKQVKLEGSAKIVLSSDGYPELKDTLEESESILERTLKDDPLCIDLFKSTKGLRSGTVSFDDRAYISFVV